MSQVPENLRYAKSHEWALVEKDIATVGITDHAQAELSDVVYVDLPKPGATFTAGAAIAVVESVKAASDIYAPLSGEVLEINKALGAQPELVNKDPYGSAWLFRLRVAQPDELGALLEPAAYRAQISG